MTKHSRLTAWIATVALACAAPFVSADNTADAVPTAQQLQTQVEQNRKAVLAKIVEPVANRVIYFDKAGKPADKPQKGGYFRRVLGKTANGGWVVEDFYQDSKTVQTSPAVLPEKDLRNFIDPKLDDGLNVGYYPDGKIQAVAEYRNGQPSVSDFYDKDGVLRERTVENKDGTMQILYFDQQGNKRAMVKINTNDEITAKQYFDAHGRKRFDIDGDEIRAFYANGRLMAVGSATGNPKQSLQQAWLEDGTEVFNRNTGFVDRDRAKAIVLEAVELNAEVVAFSIEAEAFLNENIGPFVSEFLRKK